MKKNAMHVYTIPTCDIVQELHSTYYQLSDQFELDGKTFVSLVANDDPRTVFVLEKLSAPDTYKQVDGEDFAHVCCAVTERLQNQR